MCGWYFRPALLPGTPYCVAAHNAPETAAVPGGTAVQRALCVPTPQMTHGQCSTGRHLGKCITFTYLTHLHTVTHPPPPKSPFSLF